METQSAQKKLIPVLLQNAGFSVQPEIKGIGDKADKREDLQQVFSFKLRGAYNKMIKLTPEVR